MASDDLGRPVIDELLYAHAPCTAPRPHTSSHDFKKKSSIYKSTTTEELQ